MRWLRHPRSMSSHRPAMMPANCSGTSTQHRRSRYCSASRRSTWTPEPTRCAILRWTTPSTARMRPSTSRRSCCQAVTATTTHSVIPTSRSSMHPCASDQRSAPRTSASSSGNFSGVVDSSPQLLQMTWRSRYPMMVHPLR